MDRLSRFNRIKKAYNDREKELIEKGFMLHRPTKKGIFSPSDMDEVFDFFRKIRLQDCRSFLDIGSGDGRVVLIASLFTDAEGVEDDMALLRAAERMRDSLQIKAGFIHGDYMEKDISGYDVLYWYPDYTKRELVEEKLLGEMKGMLAVYRMIYTPKKLEKVFSSEKPFIWLFKNKG